MSLLIAAGMQGSTTLGEEENVSTVVNALGERENSQTRAAQRRMLVPDDWDNITSPTLNFPRCVPPCLFPGNGCSPEHPELSMKSTNSIIREK